MSGVGGIDVAPPRRGPLLGLADQHESGTICRCRVVLKGASDVLFGLARLEPHDGGSGALLQCLEFGNEPLVIAVQHRWRGDRSSPVEQELDQPELVLDPRDVAANTDAVHRGTAKTDVLVQ